MLRLLTVNDIIFIMNEIPNSLPMIQFQNYNFKGTSINDIRKKHHKKYIFDLNDIIVIALKNEL